MKTRRKQHIENFKKLSPGDRLLWALRTGHEVRNALSEDAKRIQDSLRNGGKQVLRKQQLENSNSASMPK